MRQTTPGEASAQPPDEDPQATIRALRARLREANRDRGRTSLTLHLTRLERDKARTRAAAAETRAVEADRRGREIFCLLCELMEVVRPGMVHGHVEDDFKATVTEVRRLRADAVVAERDRTPALAMADAAMTSRVFPEPRA